MPTRILTRRAACLAALPLWNVPGRAQTGAELAYQRRGRYNEGLRGAPSTGVPLDLVAAMVDYREPYTQLPPQFQALVFVPQAQPVYLTIREVEPEYYYWLDKAQPESGWQPGRVNRFQWSTGIVIRYLTQRDRPLRLSDLGAVARLGSDVPTTPDVILPVAFYHSTPPAEALGYRFIFRPGCRRAPYIHARGGWQRRAAGQAAGVSGDRRRRAAGRVMEERRVAGRLVPDLHQWLQTL